MSEHFRDFPVENAPKGQVQSVIEDESWGRATIYDLEPEVQSPPVAEKSLESVLNAIPRKSMISKIFIHAEIAEETEENIEHGQRMDLSEREDAFWFLPFFPSALFSTILEDTITQIRILIECNTNMRITKTLTDMGLLLALKYHVEQPPVLDELEAVNPHNLKCEEYKLNKLESDRNTILDLLIMLYVDLTSKKCFLPLLRLIQHYIDRDEAFYFLIEDEAKNRLLLKEVTRQLRQQRNHHKTVIYESESVIAGLKSQVEDAALLSETQGRYVDNWQAARTEQHVQVIFEKESVHTNSTEHYKRRSDYEQRVHFEIENLTNSIITETLQKVEDWMEKYEKDMEEIDLKIQIQKNDYQNMWDKRRDMERTYNRHDREMREWLRFKEERAAAQKYHDTMMKSAIIVQAWWRGLLVRKKLGPYKPKKKGGKAKK